MAPNRISRSTSADACDIDPVAMAAVIDTIADGVVIADTEGRILAVNPEALNQMGFESVEEATRRLDEFDGLFRVWTLEGQEIPLEQWPLARALRGEAFQDLELVIERPDRRMRKICATSAAPLIANGHSCGVVISMRDITLKKSAEEALRRSEEELRLVVESAPNGILLVDEEGRIIMANPQVARAFHFSPDEIVGRNVDELVPRRFAGEHTSLRRAFIERPAKRPMGAGRDLFALRKDGTEFPVEIGLTPMQQDGRMMVLVTIVDITERKRAEQALRRSEQQTRTIMECVPQMLWMIGADGALEYANERYSAYTGSVDGDGLGDPVSAVHPDDRIVLPKDALFQGRVDIEHEARIRRYDGIYRWHLLRIVPMRRQTDTAWLATALDIDDRKRAEQQMAFLSEASRVLASTLDFEETLRHVVDLAVPTLADWCALHLYDDDGRLEPVAIAHSDPERARWAMEVSQRYPSDPEQPHGIAHVAATGDPLLLRHITDDMLVANARDDEHLELLRGIGFRSVVVVPLQARERRLGAMMMVWSTSQRLYDESDFRFAEEIAGRVATAIEHARLYREARDAEAMLKTLNEELELRVKQRTQKIRRFARDLAEANRALERRNRELQEFAYVASHDLQEPLRKIRTFGDLLSMEAGERLREEERHYLERMQHAALRMSTLIRDLLAFSRVQTKGECFERVDLARVTDEVLNDLQIAAEEVGARVEVGELCEIEADPLQMRQLIQNLLSNALKFRHDDRAPVVHIEARRVRTPDSWHIRVAEVCELRVTDNGVGFDPKYVDRIFGPFQRLHGASKYAGTGMGLAIVRRIVERHDGEITAVSRPGKGTTFVVRLPVEQEPEARRSAVGREANEQDMRGR